MQVLEQFTIPPHVRAFWQEFFKTPRGVSIGKKVRNNRIDYTLEARRADKRRRKRKMQRHARRVTRLHRK